MNLVETPSPYADRARFIAVEDGFNIRRPALSPRAFGTEQARAFAPGCPTGFVPLTCAGDLGLVFPATTPLLLALYVVIRAGETLAAAPRATGEIYVVLRGGGWTRKGDDTIGWTTGDVLCLPGSEAVTTHEAASDAVLYAVTDEPALRFLGAGPPRPGESALQAVLYPRALTEAYLRDLRARVLPPGAPGRGLNLSSVAMQAWKTCLPSLTLTYNLIAPGDTQPPHRHNAAALVLVLEPGGCQSTIDGMRLDWRRHGVVLTPAQAVHTHRNADDGDWALALIVQDGGLYYHARTMGFAFA